jgi:hypothetical protein
MDSSKIKEKLLADKKEYDEYITKFYKNIHEIDEMIWKIERLEKEEAEKKEKLLEIEA